MATILIVGAGAVGQVYGRHLQQAGHRVSFYVKPKYVEEARAGSRLFWLNRGKKPCGAESHFVADGVLSDLSALEGQQFAQVWLCIAANAFAVEWFEPFAAALRASRGQTTLVHLQPGVSDASPALEFWPPERVVRGMIGFISWQAPLKGSNAPQPSHQGYAYWFPPFSPSHFGGAPTHARQAVADLRQGECPARYWPDTARLAAQGSAVLMPFLVGLQGANWSFEHFTKSNFSGRSARAMAEASTVVAAQFGRKPPAFRRLFGRRSLKWALRLARLAVPFDLETYFAYHFTKVGPQTRQLIAAYERLGSQHGILTPSLAELRRDVF